MKPHSMCNSITAQKIIKREVDDLLQSDVVVVLVIGHEALAWPLSADEATTIERQ